MASTRKVLARLRMLDAVVLAHVVQKPQDAADENVVLHELVFPRGPRLHDVHRDGRGVRALDGLAEGDKTK